MFTLSRLSALGTALGIFVSCTNPFEGLPDDLPFTGGAGGSSSSQNTADPAPGATSNTGGTHAGAAQAGSASGGAGTAAGGTGAGGAGLGGNTPPGGASAGGTGAAGASPGGAGAGGSGAGSGGSNVTTGGSGGRPGSGTGATGGGSGASTGFSAVSAVVVRTCATAQCHGGRRNPNLTAANLYTTLMNTAVSECGNDRLVTPGDPSNSALLSLVNGLCGELVMPPACEAPPCLGTADQTTLSDWITAGAPP